MARPRHLLRLVCLFLGVLTWPVCAEDGEKVAETFNALYGADLARVRGTGDARDDAALAARLLETATKATDQPAFLALVCETAANLGLAHPDGYAAAAQAMELLAGSVPEQAAACRERTLGIRQKQFDTSRGDARPPAAETLIDALVTAADAKIQAAAPAEAATLLVRARNVARAVSSPRLADLESRAKTLTQRMATDHRISDLKALLEKSPGNVAAREELVRLYLVDLDDPAEAAKHLKGAKDEALLKYVPAAAKGADAAPEFACLELGEWYRGLAAKASKDAKAAMYARAKVYLERFLALHTAKDLGRTRAALALEKVEEAVAKLTAPPKEPTKPTKPSKPALTGIIKPAKWVDLLPLVDPATDAVKGDWQRQGSALAVIKPTAWARIVIPVAPGGSYELQVKFVRTSGGDFAAVILPVGSARVALNLSGWRGAASGIDLINGKRAKDNEAAVKPGTLVNGREYTLDITVVAKGDQARIATRLDGQPYIAWSGSQSALSMLSYLALPKSGCLGLGAYGSVVAFRSVRLRMLSGEARLVRPVEK